MSNPLKVSLENIIPLTYARDHFSQIVNEVQQDKLFVLTKGGTPAVAIIDVKYLESITGGQVDRDDVKEEIKKDPEKVGLPPMIVHDDKPTPPTPIVPATPPKPIEPKPTPPPFKPAGFAAPMPTPPKPEVDTPKSSTPAPPPSIPKTDNFKPVKPPTETAQDKPKTSPSPWAAYGSNPASTPAPTTKPPLTPANDNKPSDTLVMPTQTEPAIPNKPLTTLPPVKEEPKTPADTSSNQVDVQFSPDLGASNIAAPNENNTAPDDKNPPAQYAGDSVPKPKPAAGTPAGDLDDMAID